eukprot:scaffold650_cov407-Prasinococcus_capsulatus_cf.AAC.29
MAAKCRHTHHSSSCPVIYVQKRVMICTTARIVRIRVPRACYTRHLGLSSIPSRVGFRPTTRVFTSVPGSSGIVPLKLPSTSRKCGFERKTGTSSRHFELLRMPLGPNI